MSNRPTYRKQFDKVVAAYNDGTFDPWSAEKDFWGLIFNKDITWGGLIAMEFNGGIVDAVKNDTVVFHEGYVANPDLFAAAYKCMMLHSGGMYTVQNVVAIEKNFLSHYVKGGENEVSLHYALHTSLEMLRQMHEKLGRKGIVPKLELKMRNNVTPDQQLDEIMKVIGIHSLPEDQARDEKKIDKDDEKKS